MSTPDEEVIRKIAEALSQSNLLTADSIEKIKNKISSGTMTSEDWRLTIELDTGRKTDNQH